MATELIPITATRAAGEVTVMNGGGVEDVIAQVNLLPSTTGNPDFRDLSIVVTPLDVHAVAWFVSDFVRDPNTLWFKFKLHNATGSFNGGENGRYLVEVERKQV